MNVERQLRIARVMGTPPDLMCTIFDIDNCIADDSARIALIRWDLSVAEGRYDAYHADVSADVPRNVPLVVAAINPVFLTARPEECRAQTEDWLAKHFGITRPKVMMRPNDNHLPSTQLKRRMLEELLNPDIPGSYALVLAAYDDRPDVCAMYREYDITALQLKIHDVCAYTPPGCERVPNADVNTHPPQLAVDMVVDGAPPRAPELLEAGAQTYRERNAVYGDNYLTAGALFNSMFPDGITLKGAELWGRFCIFFHIVSKMQRYAQTIAAGGHVDSAHDSMVYSAMLEELTRNQGAQQ